MDNLQKGGEPAQAEVDQIVKKYRLEFSTNRIDESWSDGFERYCRLAVEESTATLRAELAKAKEDNEQMRKSLIVIATLSHMTGLSFESQSFRATEIARSAIAASKDVIIESKSERYADSSGDAPGAHFGPD